MPLSLRRLRANVAALLVAGVAVGGLAAGCASQERHTLSNAKLVPPRGAQVAMMPVDFFLHVDGLSGELSQAKRRRMNQEVNDRIEAWTRAFLARRGYTLGNRITWEGASGAQGFVDGPVINDIALDILDYVNEVGEDERLDEDHVVAPEALHALGSATGAEAVLYINGKASVLSSGKRTQRAVIAVCCFIATAALLYLAFNESKASRPSGRGASARRPGSVGRARPRRGGRPPRMRAGRPHRHRSSVHVGFYTPIYIHADHGAPHGGYAMDEADDEDRELKGDRVWLSFTLVRPQDGQVLWHARHTLNLSATDDEQLVEALADIARGLPPAPAGRAAPAAPRSAPPDVSAPAPGPAPAPAPATAPAPAAPDGAPARQPAPDPAPAADGVLL